MDWTSLVGLLAFFTLAVFAVLAFVSKQQVEKRIENGDAPRSTLAKDKNSHGTPADV